MESTAPATPFRRSLLSGALLLGMTAGAWAQGAAPLPAPVTTSPPPAVAAPPVAAPPVAASLAVAAPLAADIGCPAGGIDIGRLPRSIDAIAKSGEFTIVAFGSSSTAGWMSSDAGHSYPAIMQAALERALPHAHVTVVNRGIGGQDAAEELLRIDADVTALRPSLVIWQVGANGALRRMDPDLFRRLVSSGLDRLRRANLDVVLMDNQRSPMIMAAPDHGKIDGVLAQLAKDARVGIFTRSVLMDQWKTGGDSYEKFVSSDGLHHNDLGYRCIGLAVAQSIVSGLRAAQAPVMVSNALPPLPPRAPEPAATDRR